MSLGPSERLGSHHPLAPVFCVSNACLTADTTTRIIIKHHGMNTHLPRPAGPQTVESLMVENPRQKRNQNYPLRMTLCAQLRSFLRLRCCHPIRSRPCTNH